MQDIIGQVNQWNLDAGNTSTVFNVRQTAFYTGLQCEELAEKLVACGIIGMAQVIEALGQDLKKGKYDDQIRYGDREEMVDGDADLLVVTIGSAMSQGVDFKQVMNRVIAANEAKRFDDGTLRKNEMGKIIKPEGWVAPDLSDLVNTGEAI